MPFPEPENFNTIYADELVRVGFDPVPADGADPFAHVDGSDVPLVALCLSGGGIRSASFGLGVLQGLARFGLLGRFHYLSTVSGGGYIGSFLTAWRYHAPNDEAVFAGLNRPAHPDGKEAPEVAGIRAFSNYLTPKLGLLSADTWTDIAIVIRNLLLNWLVFLPFFMGVLLAPQICRDIVCAWRFGYVASPDELAYAGAAFATAGFTAASYGRRRSEGKWLTNGRFLVLVLLPLMAAAMCLTVYAGTLRCQTEPFSARMAVVWGAGSYLISSLIASVILYGREAWLYVSSRRGASPLSARQMRQDADQWMKAAHLKDAIWDLVTWPLAGALVGWLVAFGMERGTPWLIASDDCHGDGVARFLVVAGLSWAMLCVLVGELLFMGLRSYSRRGDSDREWLARSAGWLAAASLGWALLAAISLYGPLAFVGHLKWPTLGTAGISGAVSLILGNSAKTAATAAQQVTKRFSATDLASVAAVVFAVALGILLSWLDDTIRNLWGPSSLPDWQFDSAGAALLIGASVVLSIPINVNRFSLHALYRNRLVRAFLGSARNGLYPADDPAKAVALRGADPFTDFADADNLRMKDMPGGPLLHVINLTLDIVSTKNLAWQQRKAESFTVTPFACGNPHVGYRPTGEYGSKEGGISLGSAMAISGAAVSPNMGSHSSPLLGFLMTLFNLRLGWWLGNPQYPHCARQEGPSVGLWPLLQELAGQTTDERKWVYLSDGGHFDNLGLYEMVRRRCRVIVVSDAGCDPDCALSDLGDCLRKIYIDQGVSIDFRNFDIKGRANPPVGGKYAAIADISYPGSNKKGWLVYIKPGYHGNERADIRAYALAHPEFPHESTLQQWFNEAQLESYRALGAHITELLCNSGTALQPADMPRKLDIAGFKRSVEVAIRRAPQ
jgi:hypothetical protein